MRCKADIFDMEDACCLHDTYASSPDRVCCHCGEVYVGYTRTEGHGKFMPTKYPKRKKDDTPPNPDRA